MENDRKFPPNPYLRAAREGRGWSQQDLAEQIGTTAVTVSRWENGFSFPSPYFRQKLCEVFDKRPAELGLIPLHESRIWNMPNTRNPFFTGREPLLLLLHERLSTARMAALTQTQAQALYGLGGIGKTQTAVEYAFRYGDEYSGVFWIHAATRETLVADFVALAELLDLPGKDKQDQAQVVAAVKRWLSAHEDWLLILDNADDLRLAQEFLPASHKGYVLFTTRAQASGAIAASVEVEKLNPQDGILLLLRWSKLLGVDAPLEQARAEDLADAERIVREMDGLPLALVQAGAYIEETRCSLAEYLRLFATHRKDLLGRRSHLALDYTETVATTWALSFEQVEQQSSTAADVLRLCAFLAADGIPEELLTLDAIELSVVLDSALEPMIANKSIPYNAIAILSNYSLIRRAARTRMIQMNRLVQIVIKDSMDEETQKIWATRAVRAVNAALPEFESTSKEESQHYISQMQICADWIKQYHLTFFEAVNLLDHAGLYFYNQGQYAQGDLFLKQALAIREHLQNPDRIELFFSYSQKDENLLYELVGYLSLLKQQGLISTWHTYNIDANPNDSNIIKQYLNFSQIILFLVSSDFLHSDYIYSQEVRRALVRHERGEARVHPIILRPAQWEDTSFKKLQALPRDGRPVTTWQNRNEAWISIIESLRLICEEFRKKPSRVDPVKNEKLEFYRLYEVFVKSGVPNVTFVAREDFERLKLSLAQPGRGVVIEGPSGVGKTTALKKAIQELTIIANTQQNTVVSSVPLKMLSARNPEDQLELQSLPSWHNGTVIIDDFHRLDPVLCRQLVDYLKLLADTEPVSKKLVIVGIPQTGQTLVDTSFDVATRIDVFKLGQVRDGLILNMIEKGEKALNIEFDQKTEIILAANGSLNIAQFLCFNICHREQVFETENQLKVISCDIEDAISSVMTDLSRKFGESIKRFAAMDGFRDSICLKLLEELAISDDGFLSLPILKGIKPYLAPSIGRFISDRWMDKLYKEYPICANHLYFDQNIQALVVDDPQLTFYLRKLKISSLAREVGKTATNTQQKVFISYSHKDAKWLKRLEIHLKPLERNGLIDLWADTKIVAGAKWREEIQNAIESAIVAIVLVSADFLASEFISEHELPQILLGAESGGTTILSIIIAPCLFENSGLDVFQTINSPKRPLNAMPMTEQEQVLVNLAQAIRNKLGAVKS